MNIGFQDILEGLFHIDEIIRKNHKNYSITDMSSGSELIIVLVIPKIRLLVLYPAQDIRSMVFFIS